MITKQEVLKAQEAWVNAIIQIGTLKNNRDQCIKDTKILLEKLYAFEKGEILFKPTRAAKNQFRLDQEAAISYFIGGNKNYPEDGGFAMQPWVKVHFENRAMILEKNRAIAMGNYFFTDPTGNETKVEFTFGYTITEKGELKIDLHHSSLPFQ